MKPHDPSSETRVLLPKDGSDDPRSTVITVLPEDLTPSTEEIAIPLGDLENSRIIPGASLIVSDTPTPQGAIIRTRSTEQVPTEEPAPAEDAPKDGKKRASTTQKGSRGAKTEADLEKYRDLTDAFAIGEMIGRGGQGEVFEAVQQDLRRIVAVKRASKDGRAQEEFLKEAYTSAQLDHPNIVPVYDLGVTKQGDRRSLTIAMKRVRGKSWEEMLVFERAAKDFDIDAFLGRHLPILVQVINAVAYAHSKRIVHRDLKPAQVMVGEYGEVFLLDWGLAVYIGEAVSRDTPEDLAKLLESGSLFTLQSASSPAGTPLYMAPEQALFTASSIGIATDVYLVGAILFELVVGIPPHPGASVLKAVELARENVCHELPTEAPAELAELIRHCLQTLPGDRPESVLDVRARIEAYLSGAGRKAESRRITAELSAGGGELCSYEDLSDALRRLAQAGHLWPENPQVRPLRDRLLRGFVESAIAKKDFLLAQLQAGRLPDAKVAEEYEARIEAAREVAARALPKPPLLTRGRIAAMFFAYVLIAAAFLAIAVQARHAVYGEIENKVRSIAELAAREVNPRDLRAIRANPQLQTAEFQRVLSQLGAFRRSNDDIRFIYTLTPESQDGKVWRYLVDTDPVDADLDGDGHISEEEKGSPPGSLYEDGIPAMKEAFEKSVTTSAELHDSWGSFISGFAPVLDRDTRLPVALLGVDVKLSLAKDKLRLVQGAAAGGALLLILMTTATFLAFFASRRALETVKLLERQISKQNQELRGRDLSLG